MDEQAKQFELLISALNSEDENIREHACLALRKLGDLRAVEPLIVTLQDTEAFVRCAAAIALGYLGDKRAIMPLRALLTDHTPLDDMLDTDLINDTEVWDIAEHALYLIGDISEIDEPFEMLWRE